MLTNANYFGGLMNKETLKQYKDLKLEIYRLEKRIKKLGKKNIVHDSVTGSNSEFPYQPVQINIEGVVDNSDRINKLQGILVERQVHAKELQLEVEEFISSIPDSRTRMIFEDRYIYGRSWVAISRKFGSRDESYSRKVHDRFLEKMLI